MTSATKILSFHIMFPSGKEFDLVGSFGILLSEEETIGHIPYIECYPSGEIVCLDPRCVAVSSNEEICESYLPETNLGLAKWAREWLNEHSEWPHKR